MKKTISLCNKCHKKIATIQHFDGSYTVTGHDEVCLEVAFDGVKDIIDILESKKDEEDRFKNSPLFSDYFSDI